MSSEQLKVLVEQGMAGAGHAGEAVTSFDAHGLDCRFTRSDGVACGISFGGRITESRPLDDIASVGVGRMTMWYAGYDKGEFR